MIYRTWFAGVLCLAMVGSAFAQEEYAENLEYVRQNYTKIERLIPMRDGVKLHTAIYMPNDQQQSYPFLMMRTPYSSSPYGADKYRTPTGATMDQFEEGFIFVYQDVRGKYMSEGEFVNMRPHNPKKKGADVDESSDTYDTVEWLIHNIPNNNGKVGIRGTSYPGFYTSAGIIDSHPAIKAASPQAPISDWYFDDMHHHGAFSLNLAFNFFSSFGIVRPEPTSDRNKRFDHGTPDGYRWFKELGPLSNVNKNYFKGEIPFWNDMAAHPNYDAFWQARNILPHLKNVKCAVMVVGGLYDAEDLYGPFQTYKSIEEKNPGTQNTLVMGPWRHGGWHRTTGNFLGDTYFGFNTSANFSQNVELAFFRHHLKDGPDPKLPEALVFETGANRWRRFDQWPPANIKKKSLYLHKGGKLSFQAPEKGEDRFEQFVSDPAHPVPYTNVISTHWEANYMAEDQRFASTRPDVLVYTSDILEEDLTLAGPILAALQVSTTGTDADWVVKLIDVQPNDLEDMHFNDKDHVMGGAELMVRSEIMRGRYRESYEKPKPFTPDEVTAVNVPMQGVCHTFKKGHRVMIQIQSTWFPFFDRNPQKYVPNIFEATEEDFIQATHRVHSSKKHPTHLEVGVLP